MVTLDAMLDAREDRASRQESLRHKHFSAIISYTLNIAGPVKRFLTGDRCFYVGKKEIENQLIRNGCIAKESILTDAETGLECLWAVDTDDIKLKSAMAAIEENHPLGRLFDIDIIAKDGNKISRDIIHLPERACLVCGKRGAGCARSRVHSLDEIQDCTRHIIENYFKQIDMRFIAQNAMRALLYELSVSPKPGLVDRFNNGAHSDMDFFTFIDSSVILHSYFREKEEKGFANRNLPPEELLAHLRYSGMAAEEEMLFATNGVNTHKGLIFSLGVICAAFGYHGYIPCPDVVLQTAGQIAAPAFHNDLEGVTSKNAVTHGEAVYAKYGISGVRGEAAAAFPSVRFRGLPVLRKAIERGSSYNDAGVETLLHLIAYTTDTNIISRSSVEVLKTHQANLHVFLNTNPDNAAVLEYSAKLDSEFTKENISPGGCADLLAITYMLYFMTK